MPQEPIDKDIPVTQIVYNSMEDMEAIVDPN